MTELKCGGIILGCTFDHRIADAYSTNMFLLAWSAMAMSSSPSQSNIPTFHHSLLNPRPSRSHNPSIDHLYVPIASVPQPKPSHHPGADYTASRIYYVTADSVARLQASASAGGRSHTKLESFTAFVWQLAGRSSSDASERCKMGVIVDGRIRLAPDGALASYFGNVLSIPFGVETAGELVALPLSSVAERVHQVLSAVTTKEHFLDLIDWVEARRPEALVARVYCKLEGEGPAVVVSGGMRFPVGDVEFGWGKAVLGSYYFPWGGETGYVMPMPSGKGNGDWVVYVHLMNKLLSVLETETAGFFRPLSADYLGFNS